MEKRDIYIYEITFSLNIGGYDIVEEHEDSGSFEFVLTGKDYPYEETTVIFNSDDMTVKFMGNCRGEERVAECSFNLSGTPYDVGSFVCEKFVEFRKNCFDGDIDTGNVDFFRKIEDRIRTRFSFREFIESVCETLQTISSITELSFSEENAEIRTEAGVIIELSFEKAVITAGVFDFDTLTPDKTEKFFTLVRENPEVEFIFGNSEIKLQGNVEIRLDEMLVSEIDVLFAYNTYVYTYEVMKAILSKI